MALLNALGTAESKGREFVAEAAMMDPVNNQSSAVDLVTRYGDYEAEVRTLLANTGEFDERWLLLWERGPSWAGSELMRAPFHREKLDRVVRYMALRTRQLDGMVEFLHNGNEDPVRYVRHLETGTDVRDALSPTIGENEPPEIGTKGR